MQIATLIWKTKPFVAYLSKKFTQTYTNQICLYLYLSIYSYISPSIYIFVYLFIDLFIYFSFIFLTNKFKTFKVYNFFTTKNKIPGLKTSYYSNLETGLYWSCFALSRLNVSYVPYFSLLLLSKRAFVKELTQIEDLRENCFFLSSTLVVIR